MPSRTGRASTSADPRSPRFARDQSGPPRRGYVGLVNATLIVALLLALAAMALVAAYLVVSYLSLD